MTQLSNEQQAAIVAAAEKLVRCKGRYHSEQNYRALAALFGVTVPDLPPLAAEAQDPAHEATDWQVDEVVARMEGEGDIVFVPRGLLGAALGAIRHPRHEAGVTLGALRHYAYQKKQAPQPVAVPDAIHSQGESSAQNDYYALGWNACRAAMLKGDKT